MKINKVLAVGSIAGAGIAALVAFRGAFDTESLSGKVVLITGGSRGFGLAMAQEFGRRGARVVLAARSSEELERGREALVRRGVRREDVLTIACDLKSFDEAQRMVHESTSRFGRIDILVNNAGIITVGPVENQPVSAFEDAIESNYYTMLHATLATLPQMLARSDGSIVNITSIGGKVAVPHLLPYSASKFAAVGFSQGLHAELRSKGIRVTTVCPGLMRTGSHIHAKFTGNRAREYRWFSLGASLPGVSASAAYAARKVVRATISGETEITITPQAVVASALAQVVPAYTAAAMHWVNSVVLPGPSAEGSSLPVAGSQVRGKELTPLIGLGRSAARSYNESTSTAS